MKLLKEFSPIASLYDAGRRSDLTACAAFATHAGLDPCSADVDGRIPVVLALETDSDEILRLFYMPLLSVNAYVNTHQLRICRAFSWPVRRVEMRPLMHLGWNA